MYLFHLFQSFLPNLNPIGFGASDFIELILALVFAVLALAWQPFIQPYARRLALKPVHCMLLLALLPIALRLALLPQYPIPTPYVADDFSYVLIADTLRHLRLANPPHPLHQFFETFFVLQEPAYGSIFPIGQGLVLALGWTIFGHPWAGVALSVGALCALCYWMLRAWTTPGWALLGGLLAAAEFGPLSQWMNSFWGGAVAACAGCLVFGALPRLREFRRGRDAALLGLGLGLHVLVRPYESVFLLLSMLLFFLPELRKRDQVRTLVRGAAIAMLVAMPALALILLQNKQATGGWATLPYMLSRYQYGMPTTFTVQSNPTPHRPLTPQQQLGYQMQSAVHGAGMDTIQTYRVRWASRIRFYRFFLFAPLYFALPAFFSKLREYRFACILLTIAAFSLGTNFYPYFYSHYIAALTCLFVLITVVGLQQMRGWTIRGIPVGQEAVLILLFLSAAHFVFWYGLHASRNEALYTAMTPLETWTAINHGDPEGRIAIHQRLESEPGRQLVFVRYWPQHELKEWVYNAADIDGSRIIWARDLGSQENQKLLRYFPDRTAWLAEPDAHPPRLERYQP